MKIVINNTESSIFADGKLLIPGTNVLESFDEKQADAAAFVSNGSLEIKEPEKMTDKDKEKAVNEITNRDNLEKLEKALPKVDTSKAKKKLDNFDQQLKKQQG